MKKKERGRFGRKCLGTLLAAVLAPCMALAAAGDSLAAQGDLIHYGLTGDCTFQVLEEDSQYRYSFVISGQGAMQDYTKVGEYRKTSAPWAEELKRVRTVEAKDGVTTIGKYAFSAGLEACYIEKVTLADSVDGINECAFYEQCRLKEVNFGSGLTYIGYESFYGNGIQELHFPKSLTTISTRAMAGFDGTGLEFPDKLRSLGASAFRDSTNLRTVVFGSGLSKIHDYTFLKCSKLTTLVIPSTLTTIDANAFKGCDNITSIYYGGTPAQWSQIEIGEENGSLLSAEVHYGLEDAVELNTDKAIKGTKLTVRFTDTEVPFDMETAEIRWQRSWNGTTNWADLEGTVDPLTGDNYYEVKVEDEEYHIRAVITKSGFSGEVVTETVKVLDGVDIKKTFPDTALRTYISENFDRDHNGQLTSMEIEQVNDLHIGGLGISSLTGIKYLTDLQHLYAYRNNITYADLTDMNYLLAVDLSDNKNLGTVKLAGSRRLEELDVAGSGIKSVDISGNPELSTLNIYGSKIGKINIRSNPYLVDAALHGTVKEYSSYTMYRSDQGVIGLYAETPVVVSIDERHFPSECFRDMIKDQNIDWDQDGALSLKEARDVESLFPEDSEDKITTLKGIEYFPNLTYLSSFNCCIKELDLSGNTKLTHIDLSANQLTGLDVSMLLLLEELDVDYNPELKELDVSQNPKLAELYCEGCGLTKLDLSANTNLTLLSCGENSLDKLKVSHLTNLQDLNCYLNPLTSLDLSKNKALVYLSVSDTGIGKLDVSGCPKLTTLSCANLGLTKLDLSKNPKLYDLYCVGNAIQTLDIGASASLRSAYAGTRTEKTNSETGLKYWNYRSKEKSFWEMDVDKTTTIKADAEKTGTWKKSAKGWWYQYSDGTYPKNEWAKIGGKWYHFNASGYMQTGWLKLGNKWYYLTPGSGAMATGWVQVSGKWYYLTPGSGVMVTGWQEIGGKWYYFDASGAMLSGWQQISGKWYFLRNGVMVTGWQQIGGKWYFFSNGAMVTGTKTLGGKTYQFDENGVCLNP